MSPHQRPFPPPSLAQHFDSPIDHIGHFGWLCAYSGDEAFLDDAAARFTCLNRSQRAAQGRIALAVMLDPGNAQISMLQAPAVAHLLLSPHLPKPFRLLHAKVAILGFRHRENPEHWQLRLLVSTGNWTRQTLEESLDLVWRIDIGSEQLATPNPDATTRQHCADLKAAWDLLAWLQTHFDTRLLQQEITNHALEEVAQQWVQACVEQASGQPCFIDNRMQSLLSQLPEKIQAINPVRRSYLAMGSGFYESGSEPQQTPSVPLEIIEQLRQSKLLTKTAELDLYVNPSACQSVAASWPILRDKHGITVRPAATPPAIFGNRAQRSLHAKFLFSANQGGPHPKSPWVYLGSSNLTQAGLTHKMHPAAGNLEAGVVFDPGRMLWQSTSAKVQFPLVTNLLPIQWEQEVDEHSALLAGEELEELDAQEAGCDYTAPPIPWLLWHEAGEQRELRFDANDANAARLAGVTVMAGGGRLCQPSDQGFRWPHDERPRVVRIFWYAQNVRHEARIPVMDGYGRLAATALAPIDVDEAWWQLADFPFLPDDERSDDGSDDEAFWAIENSATTRFTPCAGRDYPIRQMMALLERIAAKQTRLHELDWLFWCYRLEQSLAQAASSPVVAYFRDELALNPLSPLRESAFRPSFAEHGQSALGERYERALYHIERQWRVQALPALGVMP